MRTVLFAVVFLVAGCAGTPEKQQTQPEDKPVNIARVQVPASCLSAVQRQDERAGLGLVVTGRDVLDEAAVAFLDDLYRKIHGTPGVRSVEVITDAAVLSIAEMDEQVLVAEPLVSSLQGAGYPQRIARVKQNFALIDPATLAPDLSATLVIVKLIKTSREEIRIDVHQRLRKLVEAAPASLTLHLVEYPLAAAASMHFPTERALAGIEILNRKLAGGGVLEVGVACPRSDCLLEPLSLATIVRFQRIAGALPRVKATRSIADLLRAAWRVFGGEERLPATQNQAMQLLALLQGTSGIDVHAGDHFKRGVVRVYFETGNAAQYCKLGKALKRAARESSTDSIRFKVLRPDRDGF